MAKILVVDDEQQIRSMLRQMLEGAGHTVTLAENGDEAIEIYRQSPADVILTDLLMPGKEGIETITDLLREFPDARIFAMSGGGRVGPENYLLLAHKLGALRTFSKPFSPREMLAAIEETMAEES